MYLAYGTVVIVVEFVPRLRGKVDLWMVLLSCVCARSFGAGGFRMMVFIRRFQESLIILVPYSVRSVRPSCEFELLFSCLLAVVLCPQLRFSSVNAQVRVFV